MKKTLLTVGVMAFQGFAVLCAQGNGPTILNSTGGSGVLSGNTYEYSVGEMTVVSTFTSGSLVVTQGLLQPSTGSVGIEEALLPSDAFKVYPNPASDVLYLQPTLKPGDKLSYYLTDVSGKTILRRELQLAGGNELQTVQFGDLSSGNYILHVTVSSEAKHYNNNYQVQKVR